MNNTITSRLELLLAKIAGHDVDIKTMTPGVASSLSEKLMLEIADRLDNMDGGGGSGDFIINATVTGPGEEPNTFILSIDKEIADITAAVEAKKNVRLLISGDGAVNSFVFCMGAESGFLFYTLLVSELSAPPIAAFVIVSDDECGLITQDFGGGGAEKFTIEMVNNGTWAPDDGVTVQDVVDAFNAGKICECHVPYGQDETVNLELVACDENSDFTFVRFSGVYHASTGAVSVIAVAGVHSGGSSSWSVDTTEIAIKEKVFDFEVEDDDLGGYIVTPAADATYANIAEALLMSPSVYARIELPNDGGVIIGAFTFTDNYAVMAVGFDYDNGLRYHHVEVGSDNICFYHTANLANAT